MGDLKPWQRAGLHRVRDAVMYWGTRTPFSGKLVPAYQGGAGRGNKGSEMLRALVEEAFEDVRKKVQPGAPSRVGSVMVCPFGGVGFCAGGTGHSHVYQVRVTGKVFVTNSEMFGEANIRASEMAALRRFEPPAAVQVELRRDEIHAEVSSWAKSYWQGGNSYPGLMEALVSGKAEVVRKMTDAELDALKRGDAEDALNAMFEEHLRGLVGMPLVRRRGGIQR